MYKNGAYLHPDGICTFCVWAPLKQQMTLHIVHPWDCRYAMEQDEEGYFHITLQNIPEGTRYFYEPSNTESFPDPASFAQPDGVHGASIEAFLKPIHHTLRFVGMEPSAPFVTYNAFNIDDERHHAIMHAYRDYLAHLSLLKIK